MGGEIALPTRKPAGSMTAPWSRSLTPRSTLPVSGPVLHRRRRRERRRRTRTERQASAVSGRDLRPRHAAVVDRRVSRRADDLTRRRGRAHDGVGRGRGVEVEVCGPSAPLRLAQGATRRAPVNDPVGFVEREAQRRGRAAERAPSMGPPGTVDSDQLRAPVRPVKTDAPPTATQNRPPTQVPAVGAPAVTDQGAGPASQRSTPSTLRSTLVPVTQRARQGGAGDLEDVRRRHAFHRGMPKNTGRRRLADVAHPPAQKIDGRKGVSAVEGRHVGHVVDRCQSIPPLPSACTNAWPPGDT